MKANRLEILGVTGAPPSATRALPHPKLQAVRIERVSALVAPFGKGVTVPDRPADLSPLLALSEPLEVPDAAAVRALLRAGYEQILRMLFHATTRGGVLVWDVDGPLFGLEALRLQSRVVVATLEDHAAFAKLRGSPA
jgi:hypothetical protein